MRRARPAARAAVSPALVLSLALALDLGATLLQTRAGVPGTRGLVAWTPLLLPLAVYALAVWLGQPGASATHRLVRAASLCTAHAGLLVLNAGLLVFWDSLPLVAALRRVGSSAVLALAGIACVLLAARAVQNSLRTATPRRQQPLARPAPGRLGVHPTGAVALPARPREDPEEPAPMPAAPIEAATKPDADPVPESAVHPLLAVLAPERGALPTPEPEVLLAPECSAIPPPPADEPRPHPGAALTTAEPDVEAGPADTRTEAQVVDIPGQPVPPENPPEERRRLSVDLPALPEGSAPPEPPSVVAAVAAPESAEAVDLEPMPPITERWAESEAPAVEPDLEPATIETVAETVAETVGETVAETDGETVAETGGETVAPVDIPVPATEVLSETPAPLAEPVTGPVLLEDPSAAHAVADRLTPETEDLEPTAPPAIERPAVAGPDPERLAAIFAPFEALLSPDGPVEVETRAVAAATLVTVFPARLAKDALVQVAARLLAGLAGDAGGQPPDVPDQVTVRGSEGALVITPLGPIERGGPVLVTGARRRGSLALLEILSRRAAAEHRTSHLEAPSGGAIDQEPPRAPLETAALPARIERIAECLEAFGPVAPAALWDAAADLVLYLFLPPDAEAHRLGQLARDLHHAIDGPDARGIGALHSITLRLDGHRVFVRPVPVRSGSPPCWLAVRGRVGQPGRAGLEVDRATLRLGTLRGGDIGTD